MTRDMTVRGVLARHTCAITYEPGAPSRWWLRCDCGAFTTTAPRDHYGDLSPAHRLHIADAMRAAGVTGW